MKDITAAQSAWNDQRDWLYSKSDDKRSFIDRVKHAFDVYIVYSTLNHGYYSATEVYVDVLGVYCTKMNKRVINRIMKDGFEAQHLFKKCNQYRLTPVGRRANWQIRNVLKRLDKNKNEFGYESLFDIIS